MKRPFDIAMAAVLLLATAPIMLLAALLVRVTFGRPLLFRQVRPGRNAVPFTILKFRTMREASDDAGRTRPDAARLTATGRFLRSTSIDELPELWNVLKGEMSMVGPRPLLVEYLPLYTPEQARRHLVRPGLTGLAQVSGRNAVSWPERLALDVWYVDHQSMWLDLAILVRTVMAVLARRGISAEGEATMPRFTGTRAPRDSRGV